MNLCKNDCAFSEPQYKPVITNANSVKSNSNTHHKGHSRYSGKIKALDGLWLELRNAAGELSSSETNSKGPGGGGVSGSEGGGESGGMVSCLPILRESSSNPLNKGNGLRIDCTQLGPIHRKSHQRIISIKNLFSNAPKFQKHFHRGVFLSCLIYSEDKLLVTDDVLPTFQIDEDLSSSFQHDFHWLHKISSIWNDAKFLKQEMEKCDSASTLHFRVKLLQTLVTMQDSLDLHDLGKVYYKPITTENNNVTFICTVNHIRSTKLVSGPNVRWIPVEKFRNKKPISDTYQVLSSSYQNLMLYYQMSNIPLGKGLYLGYFKLVSSVELLKLIVPEKTPSIIPHVKIRNNPQVTKAEWELLSTFTGSQQDQNAINNNEVEKVNRDREPLTETQQAFRQQLDSSLKKLFATLRIDRNSALNHRLYTTEVIEVSSSVTLIIVLPPTENACLIEGDLKDLKWIDDNKLMTLPVQVFEMTHMLTYHNTLARRLMRLSSTLEVETVLAQHNRRKAFSTEEMSLTQTQVSTLTNLHMKLDQTWKDCRWMLDVVKAARAKDRNFVIIRDFLNRHNTSPSKSVSSQKNATTALKKSLKESYNANASQPFSRLQLQHLLKLRKSQQTQNASSVPQLRDPNIPSNPNFKFESCSSLPIVGKTSTPNFDKLRTSSSLFELQLGKPNNNTQLQPCNSSSNLLHQNLGYCTEEFMKLGLHLQTEDEPDHHYQNVQEVCRKNGTTRDDNDVLVQNFQATFRPPMLSTTTTVSIPMQQELDSYMKHKSSSSKLVSLTTMTNRLKDNNHSYRGGGECIPGTSDPAGLRTLSWTKQRTSLDRCFNLNATRTTMSCSSICSEGSSSRELLQEDGNETDTDTSVADIRNSSAFATSNSGISKVVEIYAAYDCGLSTGTCVRLNITSDTVAKQIVHLLVNKLNEEVKTKGQQALMYSNMDEFCLVSVIGARERVLRMDYKPLRLQTPWDSARLFVRKKNDVTSAVSLEAKLRLQKS